MMAIAEVYETEITRVQVGQPAMLASEYGGFDGTVRGQVEHISLQVGQRSLSEGSTNPTTDEKPAGGGSANSNPPGRQRQSGQPHQHAGPRPHQHRFVIMVRSPLHALKIFWQARKPLGLGAAYPS